MKPVFLAAPEANAADLGLIDKLLVSLEVASGGAVAPRHVFVPHLGVGDVGVDVDAGTYFSKTLKALQDAKVLVAVLDGAKTDDGVAFLVAYAYAAEKVIIGYRTDRRLTPHPLVEGVLSEVVSDVKSLAAALRPHV